MLSGWHWLNADLSQLTSPQKIMVKTAEFMTEITCGLTVWCRDQLWPATLNLPLMSVIQ